MICFFGQMVEDGPKNTCHFMYLYPHLSKGPCSIVIGGKHDKLIPMGSRVPPKPPVCVGKVIGFIFLDNHMWLFLNFYLVMNDRRTLLPFKCLMKVMNAERNHIFIVRNTFWTIW